MKVILIFVLLFSSTWAVISNDNPNPGDEDPGDDDNNVSSSDESDDGKLQNLKLIICKNIIRCYKN